MAVKLGSRKILLMIAGASIGAAALMAVAVFARELGAREAREKIAHALGLADAKKVQVKYINAVGGNAVVEATVDVAFQLADDKKGGWTVTQVRTGDRCWESVDMIRTAIAKEKILRTSAQMGTLGSALALFQRDHGSYVVADSGVKLADSLSPNYLATVIRLDAWSNEFKYQGTRSSYRIVSAGPDGKFGTADDLVMENGKMIQGAPQ